MEKPILAGLEDLLGDGGKIGLEILGTNNGELHSVV
jgi:hypothetical protein